MRWLVLGLLAACGFEAPGEMVVDAQIDAPLDARPFDPGLDCPASYTITMPGQTSRYRMILQGQNVKQQHDACAGDRPGATHLAALDSLAEIAEAQAKVNSTAGLSQSCAWIGGVQLRSQAAPAAGWLQITGGPLFLSWDPAEPNDGGNYIEDSEENFLFLGATRTSQIDIANGPTFGALCECDGKPIDPAADVAITASL